MKARSVSRVITIVVIIVASILPTVSAIRVPSITQQYFGNIQSSNWSGYAVTSAPGSVSDVKGSWTVPAIKDNCSGSRVGFAAFWVGMDGLNSKTVEQTGTESFCFFGIAAYYAWYEFYPQPAHLINGLTLNPGDHITAEVRFNGGKFTLNIADTTTGKSFSPSKAVSSAQRNSAEWIAEAPSFLGRYTLPFPDFGTVQYTANSATIGGNTGPIGSFGSSVQKITMTNPSTGTVLAKPSSLSTVGDFSVQWES